MNHYPDQYNRLETDWPSEKRIDTIGSNGNTGCHYPKLERQMENIPEITKKNYKNLGRPRKGKK